MRTLRGKTALVTGAASGIGRAIALALADEGMTLRLLDVDSLRLESAVAFARLRGAAATGVPCDLTVPAQITAVVQRLLAAGGVDLLVNNAGITYYGRTENTDPVHWQRVMAVNLLAPMQLTHELLPSFLARDEAHVLNVASIFGLAPMPRVAAYAASKHGLVGFSQSLRLEYGRTGLGVTALCPGFVATELFDAAPLGADRLERKRPPRWMQASPERVAERAVTAVRRNEGVVVFQGHARLLHWTHRLAPWATAWVSRLGSRRPCEPPSLPESPAERRLAA